MNLSLYDSICSPSLVPSFLMVHTGLHMIHKLLKIYMCRAEVYHAFDMQSLFSDLRRKCFSLFNIFAWATSVSIAFIEPFTTQPSFTIGHGKCTWG